LEIQHLEELDQVDAGFHIIAQLNLYGANDPYAQPVKEAQVDIANVDQLVTIFVRAVELLLELSHCQSYYQGCWQSSASTWILEWSWFFHAS